MNKPTEAGVYLAEYVRRETDRDNRGESTVFPNPRTVPCIAYVTGEAPFMTIKLIVLSNLAVGTQQIFFDPANAEIVAWHYKLDLSEGIECIPMN
jgi:hypothetical protein